MKTQPYAEVDTFNLDIEDTTFVSVYIGDEEVDIKCQPDINCYSLVVISADIEGRNHNLTDEQLGEALTLGMKAVREFHAPMP